MILLILENLVYLDRVCVCVCVCVWLRYTVRYGGQRWQYSKSLSLWGHFFFAPLRKQAYKSYRMKFFENLKSY